MDMDMDQDLVYPRCKQNPGPNAGFLWSFSHAGCNTRTRLAARRHQRTGYRFGSSVTLGHRSGRGLVRITAYADRKVSAAAVAAPCRFSLPAAAVTKSAGWPMVACLIVRRPVA